METVRGVVEDLDKVPTKTGKHFWAFGIDGTRYSTFKIPKGLAEGDRVEFQFVTKGKYNNVKGDMQILLKGEGEPAEEETGQTQLPKPKPASELGDTDSYVSEAALLLSKCKDACKEVLGEEDKEFMIEMFRHASSRVLSE